MFDRTFPNYGSTGFDGTCASTVIYSIEDMRKKNPIKLKTTTIW
jgi:hypothetical protein